MKVRETNIEEKGNEVEEVTEREREREERVHETAQGTKNQLLNRD